MNGLKIGCFSGVCGYLVSMLSTDSTVNVAPIFWIILGTGFAVNAYVKKKASKQVSLLASGHIYATQH
jgi:hypothetical protein